MEDEAKEAVPGAGAGAGKVHLFNVTDQELRLVINGMPAGGGSIPGWSQGYRPNGQAVPRARYPDGGEAAFCTGNNMVALQWGGGSSSAQVNIDGNIPLNQDLLLFVERNQWQLIGQNAELIASGPVSGMG